MDTALSAALALLFASGVLVTLRLVRGPTTLDRAVALDALVAVLMAGIAVQTALQRIPYYLPALLVLAFLGFTGSVGIARFMALRDETGGTDPDARDQPDRSDEPGPPDASGRPGQPDDEPGETP